VKFMYTGQLKMTKHEIEKEHMVWHVNHILIDLFRVDAKLNLPAHLLQPPPKKPEPDPPPSSGRGRGERQSRSQNGNSGSSTPSQGDVGSGSPKVSDIDNTRQNTVIPVDEPEKEEGIIASEINERDKRSFNSNEVNETEIESKNAHKVLIEPKGVDNKSTGLERNIGESSEVEMNSNERERHRTGDSDIQEVEQERVATPDIIDLLESDPEDESSKEPEGNLNEDPMYPTFSNDNIIEKPGTSSNDNVPIPMAPKLIQRTFPENQDEVPKPSRAVARKHTASFAPKNIALGPQESEQREEVSASQSDTQEIVVSPEIPKKRAVARKHTGPRGEVRKRKHDDIFTLAMKEAEIEVPSTDLPFARKSNPEISPMTSFRPPIDVMATFQGLQPLAPSLLTDFQGPRLPPPTYISPNYLVPQLGPTQTIYRGKLTNLQSVSKYTPTRGVRKHNHIPWTMTGLKRAETFAVIKEEKTIHTCDICGAKYEKYRSLEIHKRRTHNENSKVECPEGCGKLLSNTHAIRKHLLSHRPEEEWPHECPLCHKKFQARGDIPKHLKTRLHVNDNIPIMGTKEWFDLIYHDDPNYNYGAMKVKLEKQEARERSKLPAGVYPVGLINLEDPTYSNGASLSSSTGTGFIGASGAYNTGNLYGSIVASGASTNVIASSEGDLPSISHLEGLENSDSLLEAILPSNESPLNVFTGSDALAVFTEDGLFSDLVPQASVIL